MFRTRKTARVAARVKGARKRTLALVSALAGTLAALGGASPALAGVQAELAVFNDCPLNTPGVTACIVSRTTSGEFKLGSKTVTVNKTITLQGGVSELTHELIPAVDGNTLSKTPLTVPGGLVGIEGLGGEVTATAELAGPIILELEAFGTNNPVIMMPLKVKLDNPVLGSTCYIGSNAEQVKLNLTAGTTNPPPPNKPITGSGGKDTFLDHNKIIIINGSSLVDNSFRAPGVNGCGLIPLLIDPIVNLDAGLPAAAGSNTAILNGSLESASVRALKSEAVLPELGRCVKVAPVSKEFHGLYVASNCDEESPAKEGKFEWIAGAGAAKTFTGTSGKTTLETVGGSKVLCSASTSAGEYTGTKTATLAITLTGCQNGAKESCQSAGAGSGEIVTSSLAGELGFVKDFYEGETRVTSVGLDLKHSPSVLTAACGASKQALVVEGSAIGPFTAVDKMTSAFTLKYAAAAGKQLPEQFEIGPKDTLAANFGAGAEQAGLTSTQKLTNAEKLEIKSQTTEE